MVALIHSLPPQERGEAVNEVMQEFSELFSLVDALDDGEEDDLDQESDVEPEDDAEPESEDGENEVDAEE